VTLAWLVTTPATITGVTYTDTTAANGTGYAYAVKAVNTAARRVSRTASPPRPPRRSPFRRLRRGLKATAGNNTVALCWTASTGPTSSLA
jgi:hypothetical protein